MPKPAESGSSEPVAAFDNNSDYSIAQAASSPQNAITDLAKMDPRIPVQFNLAYKGKPLPFPLILTKIDASNGKVDFTKRSIGGYFILSMEKCGWSSKYEGKYNPEWAVAVNYADHGMALLPMPYQAITGDLVADNTMPLEHAAAVIRFWANLCSLERITEDDLRHKATMPASPKFKLPSVFRRLFSFAKNRRRK